MKKIILGRGGGKTIKLVLHSSATRDYIVCTDSYEAKIIQETAEFLNVSIPYPITYEEFINKRYYAKGIEGFCIDNAEFLLQYMTSVPINAITINKDD